jgi:hypothetical protein
MLRERNQNLAFQAAVVIFAMLTVVLGVTTFVFVRKCDDLRTAAAASREEAGRSQAAAGEARRESDELKGLIGLRADERMEAIRAEFARDMETCPANLPPQGRFYRTALSFLNDLVTDQSKELGHSKSEIDGWKEAFARREESKDGQIRRFRDAATLSGSDAQAATAAAGEERKRLSTDMEILQARMVALRNSTNQAVAAAQKKQDAIETKYRDLLKEYARCKAELDELRRTDFTAAHGQILRVSYPLRTAWIDLGLADAVRQFLSFNVYPANAARLNPSTAKGKIEVTKVVEEHLAETRMVEDKAGNPLVAGDKIHSPGWRLGQR